jgi:hypothetical protein
MRDLGRLLREADPLAHEPGLSTTESLAMRRAVVRASREVRRAVGWWPQPLAVAALVALMLAVGIAGGRRMPPPARSLAAGPDSTAPSPERRQLQFSTPGGTRIIWVFNSELNIKEVMP